MIKIFTIFFSLLALAPTFFSQTKHALLVGVGDYPDRPAGEDSWNDLSSENDLKLVKSFLLSQKFSEKNTHILYNTDATVENLVSKFEFLINTVQLGDVVFFHFSGHGQQVADLNGKDLMKNKMLVKDEEDNYDEALVLYNAPLKWKDGYELEHHFVDDQMNYYLSRLRKKLGNKGQIVVVLDACHSGTATRGAESLVVRGTTTVCAPKDYSKNPNGNDESLGFDSDMDYSLSNELSGLIAFFGCKAEQVNRETRDEKGIGYGSLTYYFIHAVNELKEKSSYQNLFSKINESMILEFRNAQNPVIEGDKLDALIFSGKFVEQQPFFEVESLSANTAILNAGQLRGVQVGDSIGLFDNTTLSVKEGKLLMKGICANVEALKCTLNLDKSFKGNSIDGVKYRAFVINPTNNTNIIRLKLNIENKANKKKMQSFFEAYPNVQLSDKTFDYLIADTQINNTSHVVIFLGNNQTNKLRGMSWRSFEEKGILDSMLIYLSESVKTDAFRNLDVFDEEINCEIKIFPCLESCDSKSGQNVIYSETPVLGNFQVKEANWFKLTITNTSEHSVYLNIVDIYPDNKLDWLENGRNNNLTPKSKNSIYIQAFPPFGIEQFKVLLTNESLNLSSLTQNGSSLTRDGKNSPLLQYMESTIKGTRGGRVMQPLGATVKTINFEIIPK